MKEKKGIIKQPACATRNIMQEKNTLLDAVLKNASMIIMLFK